MNKIPYFILVLLFIIFSCKDNKYNTNITSIKIASMASVDSMATITVVFGGDIMFHTPQLRAALGNDNSYNFSPSFKHIKEQWQGADAVVFNLETTLASDNFSGYPMFASPKSIAKDLKSIGVTHLMLANNHICDRRAYGVKTTVEECSKSGIITAGAYTDTLSWRLNNPLYIKKEGFNIALLNYTYGTNGMPIPKGMVVPLIDTVQMAKDIQKAKDGFATNIVVFIHWGNEYITKPSLDQRKLAAWLQNKGVDIVVGSHPHVVQPIEVIENRGIVIYSMGNLISNQQKQNTNGGILVKVSLQRNKYSGETHYKAQPLPHYVYIAPYGDSPRYYCMPPKVVDSLLLPTNPKKALADQFFTNCAKILAQ